MARPRPFDFDPYIGQAYADAYDARYYVRGGFSGAYRIFRQERGKSTESYKQDGCTWRESYEEAQQELDGLATKYNWQPVMQQASLF
ncbi:hypothetical protein LJC27_01955 [Christensenellaceae bacterium OttesenSCG-928-M15]|nr:hypothetical protein [Christensenellaceae bacterium OttesenSCG-928-M15]